MKISHALYVFLILIAVIAVVDHVRKTKAEDPNKLYEDLQTALDVVHAAEDDVEVAKFANERNAKRGRRPVFQNKGRDLMDVQRTQANALIIAVFDYNQLVKGVDSEELRSRGLPQKLEAKEGRAEIVEPLQQP